MRLCHNCGAQVEIDSNVWYCKYCGAYVPFEIIESEEDDRQSSDSSDNSPSKANSNS
jgi:DNA-directed RNA polymerase subunit RPC12/RpoP